MMPVCEVWRLRRVAYAEAWALQNRLVNERGAGAIDRLLLLEHPPIYTLGSSGHEDYVLLSPEELARRGIDVLRVDRGGDVTYHGPGQLIGYPILQLERDNLRTDVVGYVRKLEQVIIALLADYGITAKPIKGLTGVWVATPFGEAKIAAIGVKVNVRAVTKHGFALNLNTDLSYFDGIIPCGIRDKGVTSLAALLGTPVDEADAAQRLVQHFGVIFDRQMIDTTPQLTDSS